LSSAETPANPAAQPVAAAPFDLLTAPASWAIIDFISDLHLQADEASTAEAWGGYLAQTPADALFILGDLFEVWVGDDALEPGSFERQCAERLHHAAQRTAVYFMHGNRDFLVGQAAMRACGATLIKDPTVLAFAGERWLLSHGDALCLADAEYQAFRAKVRGEAWQREFLAQSLATRKGVARQMRAESDARRQTGFDPGDVDGMAAAHWLESADCRTLIHGHTHRPATHALAPALQRVVLSDWDCSANPPRAEVLRLTALGLTRIPLV
jgi:UDP-2,3-diacylglucosamine hydrolase